MPNLQPFKTIVASKNLPTLLLDSRASCVSPPYMVSPPAPASAIASSCSSYCLFISFPSILEDLRILAHTLSVRHFARLTASQPDTPDAHHFPSRLYCWTS
ncbi:uncharacterized protein ACHE_30915A [Aspergillus chevalieri]|uniref:Uncharacterized protein n=1 Tax=Aspergillus chevalieri TaxID=182096 RepID=A0A7R7ZLY6_ASPCH|nr:uncharacterized protein ACHE_30915A [Aspergillus chevalieri]BCR86928.1 hypothetical protein ACHE_30915A [Aspergillus chevalieri]